ncbi:Uncharacterised protein [Xylophilus ampelinus]|nr:Uncharacterised protein [Xylophilus ampelinus]
MSLIDFLTRVKAGQTAFAVIGDDYDTLEGIARTATVAERSGYVLGLSIDNCKGRDTYGRPLRLRLAGLTPVGEEWLQRAQRSKAA